MVFSEGSPIVAAATVVRHPRTRARPQYSFHMDNADPIVPDKQKKKRTLTFLSLLGTLLFLYVFLLAIYHGSSSITSFQIGPQVAAAQTAPAGVGGVAGEQMIQGAAADAFNVLADILRPVESKARIDVSRDIVPLIASPVKMIVKTENDIEDQKGVNLEGWVSAISDMSQGLTNVGNFAKDAFADFGARGMSGQSVEQPASSPVGSKMISVPADQVEAFLAGFDVSEVQVARSSGTGTRLMRLPLLSHYTTGTSVHARDLQDGSDHLSSSINGGMTDLIRRGAASEPLLSQEVRDRVKARSVTFPVVGGGLKIFDAVRASEGIRSGVNLLSTISSEAVEAVSDQVIPVMNQIARSKSLRGGQVTPEDLNAADSTTNARRLQEMTDPVRLLVKINEEYVPDESKSDPKEIKKTSPSPLNSRNEKPLVLAEMSSAALGRFVQEQELEVEMRIAAMIASIGSVTKLVNEVYVARNSLEAFIGEEMAEFVLNEAYASAMKLARDVSALETSLGIDIAIGAEGNLLSQVRNSMPPWFGALLEESFRRTLPAGVAVFH